MPAGDRDTLVAGTVVMAFPSEYEGFGAPLVEAMTLATPVVCSRAEAVVEVAGAAAVIVEDATAQAWAAAVEQAMIDGARLVELGADRCRLFTPEISGRALAEAYRRALYAMRVVVLCPHFEPDTAPTGVVMTRIVSELAAFGHELHVVTALPWYRHHRIEADWRIDAGWTGRWIRTESTAWGTVTRVHPFPGDDKRDLVRRAAGFRRLLGAGRRRRVAGRWVVYGRPTSCSRCRRR